MCVYARHEARLSLSHDKKREPKSVRRMSVSVGGESAREEAGKMAAVAWR